LAEINTVTTWRCPRCSEILEAQFDNCWKCGEAQPGIPTDKDLPEETAPLAEENCSNCGCMGQVLGPSLETQQPENAPLGDEQSQLEDSEHEFHESENNSCLPMVIAVIAVLVMLWFYGG
jgi:hypothetical protein